MVPTSYTELFIFLVGAVGAALLVGTGAALLRFRRTGSFPGEDPAQADGGATPVRAVIVRCALGAVVLAAALAALAMVRA
ncbi:MAG: hypothetical protein WD080_01335 [Egibacteraceae bacterium]